MSEGLPNTEVVTISENSSFQRSEENKVVDQSGQFPRNFNRATFGRLGVGVGGGALAVTSLLSGVPQLQAQEIPEPKAIVTLSPDGFPPTPMEAAQILVPTPIPQKAISGISTRGDQSAADQYESSQAVESEISYEDKLNTVMAYKLAYEWLAENAQYNNDYFKYVADMLGTGESDESLDSVFNKILLGMLSFKEASINVLPDSEYRPQHVLLDLINNIIISRSDDASADGVAKALIKDDGYFFTMLSDVSPSGNPATGRQSLRDKLVNSINNGFYSQSEENPNELVPNAYALGILGQHLELADEHVTLLEEYFEQGTTPFQYPNNRFILIIDPTNDTGRASESQQRVLIQNNADEYVFETYNGLYWIIGGVGPVDPRLQEFVGN